MESSAITSFREYISRTTRREARQRRLDMISKLDGREFASIRDLVRVVGGNANDRTWLAQALRDGHVVIASGHLTFPPSRPDTLGWNALLARLAETADLLSYQAPDLENDDALDECAKLVGEIETRVARLTEISAGGAQ